MPKGSKVAALTIGAGFALAAGACGISPEATPRAVDRADIPFSLPDTSSTTTTTTTSTTVPDTTTPTTPPATVAPGERVKVYLVQGTGNLVPVERLYPADPSLGTIITDLEADPSPAELAAGLRSALAPRGTIVGLTVEGGTATVDLAPSFRELVPNPTEQQLAAGQLAMTLLDRGPGIGRVRFTIAGQPITVPRGDGSTPQTPDQSVSREDYLSIVLAPTAG
jgi:hypothetical protein